MIRQEPSGGVKSIAVATTVILIVITAVLSYALLTTKPIPNTSTSTNTSYVRVFGLVSATGTGVHPTDMIFADDRGGRAQMATIAGNGFSIQLPNHRMYNVSMGWVGNYSWQTGREEMGQLTVDMTEGSMMSQSYNVVQATPDSEVVVNGALSWQMVTGHPTAIKFTATNGETYQTTVKGQSFAIKLPNMMTYEVNVAASNATGYIEWYYFHQLRVNAGVNVIGLTVKLG